MYRIFSACDCCVRIGLILLPKEQSTVLQLSWNKQQKVYYHHTLVHMEYKCNQHLQMQAWHQSYILEATLMFCLYVKIFQYLTAN